MTHFRAIIIILLFLFKTIMLSESYTMPRLNRFWVIMPVIYELVDGRVVISFKLQPNSQGFYLQRAAVLLVTTCSALNN